METRQIHVVIPPKFYSKALAEFLQDTLKMEDEARLGADKPYGWALITDQFRARDVYDMVLEEFGHAVATQATIGESFKNPSTDPNVVGSYDNLQMMIEQIQKSQDMATFGRMGRDDVTALTSALSVIREELISQRRELDRLQSRIS